jgi:Zn-dependent peptidase ImmA (M78 family)
LIESGQRAVSSVELGRLARLYGRQLDELLDVAGGSADADSSVMRYFRAAGQLAPSTERHLQTAEREWQRYAELEQLVYGAQRYELPSYPLRRGRPYEQGERLAMQERRRLALGIAPIRSVIALLEDEGVKVLMIGLGRQAEVSGCYFFSETLGPCVLINEDELPSRRRFTASHEYCHFLVDRAGTEGEVCSHSRSREPFEQRANAFAASFLLPAPGIDETLGDMGVRRGAVGPEDLVHLMYRFGASYEAVSWRLVNLGWITAAQRQAYAQVSSTELARTLGYGETIPGQTEPRPSRMHKLAVEAWREGHLDPAELASWLGMPVEQVETAFGATDGSRRASTDRRAVEEPDWF